MKLDVLGYAIILAAFVGIAVGRLPRLRMDRTGMALAAAALLIAVGAIPLDEALEAVDLGTIALLLAMMLIVANLRLAGFFTSAGSRVLSVARSPRQLLAMIVAASGLMSALFLNDTICLMLTPLVAELALRSRRDPIPYLLGVATAANIGSCATIVGNPQNMLIGAQSGISFARFLARLGPPSLIGLVVCWIVIVLSHPAEFGRGGRLDIVEGPRPRIYKPLLYKSLASAVFMVILLLAGYPAATASLAAAAFLLITRRVSPEKVFAEVDFSLLVFFAGLFILTRTVEGTPAFQYCVERAMPILKGGNGASPLGLFAAVTAISSNLISNVPAVMVFRPFVVWFEDVERAWLVLALASTFAGNLTLLGSVANLIVAEGARRSGIEIKFTSYLRVGLPITLATVVAGTAWILWT